MRMGKNGLTYSEELGGGAKQYRRSPIEQKAGGGTSEKAEKIGGGDGTVSLEARELQGREIKCIIGETSWA